MFHLFQKYILEQTCCSTWQTRVTFRSGMLIQVGPLVQQRKFRFQDEKKPFWSATLIETTVLFETMSVRSSLYTGYVEYGK